MTTGQAHLHAVFLGQIDAADRPIFQALETRGIKTLHFEGFQDLEDFFHENVTKVGAFVLCAQRPDEIWDKLSALMSGKEADYIPFIDLGGRENLPAPTRLRRLVYAMARPVDPVDLANTIQIAFLENLRYHDLIREVESRSSAIGSIRAGLFEVKNIREAKNLTTMLSLACPNAKVAAFVLSELIINAIEHGNLGITYEEKSDLVASGNWGSEVDRRLMLDENADKKVTVQFERGADETSITITDMGKGFDWRSYVSVTQGTGDKQKFSGRGIALTNAMDNCKVQYHGIGNAVTVVLTS